MPKRNLNLFILLSFLLILSACGGGGGGGAATGGGTSYTVPTCSDTGTVFQTNEYYTIGGNSGGRSNQLELVCASTAYARGATGDGITIAVVDTGGPWNAAGSLVNNEFDSDSDEILKPSNSDYYNSDNVPNDDYLTMLTTLQLALELNTAMMNVYPCMNLPGSQFYEEAKSSENFRENSYKEFAFLSYESNPSGTSNLSSKEVIGFRDYFWKTYRERI